MIKSNRNKAEEKKISKKERIQQLIKKPKEKFLTETQKAFWELLDEKEIVLCFGPSGVGKSYIIMKKALDLLHDETNKYERILLIRPAVEADESIGFLPGDLKEKLDPFIGPSYHIIEKIVGRESKELLIDDGFIEVNALAFIRGWTIDNTILIFEEGQNSTPKQMKLLLTRIGYNSKFFISGDIEQSDKYKKGTDSGLYDAKTRLERKIQSGNKEAKKIGIFEFGKKDVVRNPLVGFILDVYED